MRIALVLNDDFSAWHFRRGLIGALIDRGHSVTVVCPTGPYIGRLTALGAAHIPVAMNRFLSPLSDLRLTFALYRIFRKRDFDLVHTMTIKPNIFGPIAARLARVRHVVGLVSGLGYAFAPSTAIRDRALSAVVSRLYRFANGFAERVWFQNPDDLREFVRRGLLPSSKAVLIRGSGVDLDEYNMARVSKSRISELRREFECESGSPVVLMVVARVVWSKGTREFADAAAKIIAGGLTARFLLIGPLDPDSPDAVSESFLKERESAAFHWAPFRDDIRDVLAVADVVVLPSYYPEGLPRVLLEAMSLEKAIVTTDSVGCREAVDHGVSGYLVPPRDVDALADAIARLLANQTRRVRFGREGRRLVGLKFSDQIVVDRVLRELYRLPGM